VEGFLVPSPDRTIKANLPDALKARADRLWAWIDGRARGESVGDVDDVLDELDRYGTLFAPLIVERTLRASRQAARIDELRATESKPHGMFEESQATLQTTVNERDALVNERDVLVKERNALLDRERDLQQKLDCAAMRADTLEGDLERTRAYLDQV